MLPLKVTTQRWENVFRFKHFKHFTAKKQSGQLMYDTSFVFATEMEALVHFLLLHLWQESLVSVHIISLGWINKHLIHHLKNKQKQKGKFALFFCLSEHLSRLITSPLFFSTLPGRQMEANMQVLSSKYLTYFSITLTCERLYVAVSTLGCVCNSQVYVSENNIFLKSDVTAEAVQVTTNGKKNEIFNGIPDWVYEGKPYRVAEWHNRAAWCPLDYCSYRQQRVIKSSK